MSLKIKLKKVVERQKNDKLSRAIQDTNTLAVNPFLVTLTRNKIEKSSPKLQKPASMK